MLYEDNYLAHFGIKGQRWGLRRYQNEDGTLTSEGREHYGVGKRKLDKMYRKENKKLIKLANKADLTVQTRKVEYHKDKAKHNLKRGILDAGLLVGTRLGSQLYGKALLKRANLESGGLTSVFGPNNLHDVQKLLEKKEPTNALANKIAETATTAIFGGGAALRVTSAAVHGIKAAAANKRISEIGHAKAEEKFTKQLEKMGIMFEGTKYSEDIERMKEKRHSSDEKKEPEEKKTPEENEKLYNEGKAKGKSDIDKIDRIEDPTERAKQLEDALKKAKEALGPYADTTYPGFDEDGDVKSQAYNIGLCQALDKKIKGIVDPLGLQGNGTDGRTPGTKAITDKMLANIEAQSAAWNRAVEEYKKDTGRDIKKADDYWKVSRKYESSDGMKLEKEYADLESKELRAQVLKDLGLPVTPTNMGLIYPFLYYDSFNDGDR